MDVATMCQCCHADDACEYDLHVGEVCQDCGELLEEIGWGLVEHPVLGLDHPPPLGSPEATQWPHFTQ